MIEKKDCTAKEESGKLDCPTQEYLHQEFLKIWEKAKTYQPSEKELKEDKFILEQLEKGVSERDILKGLGWTEEELSMLDDNETESN